MKKLKYLFLIVFIFLLGIVSVNAEKAPTDLTPTADRITLHDYNQGVASETILYDSNAIAEVINIVNQKKVPNATVETSTPPVPYMEIEYSDSTVKVKFNGANLLSINSIQYVSTYDGDLLGEIRRIFAQYDGNIKPDPETDSLVDLLKIDVKADTGNAGASLYMNAVLPEGFELSSNSSYYVKFVNQGDPKPTDIPNNWSDNVDYDSDDISKWKTISTQDKYIYIADDWYLLNGYDYAYFLSCDSQSCQVSKEPVKVNRPELPKLSQRYHVYAFVEDEHDLTVFPYFPYSSGINGSHKLIVKIGVINDEELLYSIYKNEEGALLNLMKYAQESEGKTYSAIDNSFRSLPLEGLEVQNGAYYYIYTTYENTDGMYRDLSDISIAMGEAGMIVNDIEWNFSDDIDNASTGDINVIAFVAGAILLAGISVVAYKKQKLN